MDGKAKVPLTSPGWQRSNKYKEIDSVFSLKKRRPQEIAWVINYVIYLFHAHTPLTFYLAFQIIPFAEDLHSRDIVIFFAVDQP